MYCTRCNKKGHTVHFCKEPAQQTAPTANTGVSRSCYECGETGHIKRDCSKTRNARGVGRVVTMGHEQAVADPTMVTGTFLLNDSYACILFNSGAESSFVSHQFKHLLNQIPKQLNETFTVEMANGKTENTNDIYVDCTLSVNNRSFQINLMPVSIKFFDVIGGMDWLCPHRADILCYKKVVHLNLPNGNTLIIYGDKPNTNLSSFLVLMLVNI
ncbi:uncharacterized protein LOC111916435 [Lactuca sativa]|uniref:uncharacterized protein LOC111916435 n=1 Tax=Lactuca sativa TaxID=4236 RepID=UPI000CD9E3BB|nr:uncharacterized protein LOC111916435 [Lactuca sativa]